MAADETFVGGHVDLLPGHRARAAPSLDRTISPACEAGILGSPSTVRTPRTVSLRQMSELVGIADRVDRDDVVVRDVECERLEAFARADQQPW